MSTGKYGEAWGWKWSGYGGDWVRQSELAPGMATAALGAAAAAAGERYGYGGAEKRNGCAGLERARAAGDKACSSLAWPHGAGHR